MKKKLLLISLIALLTVSLHAQNDKFNTFLANYKELKMPATVSSADVAISADKNIDQKLSWEFYWQKNEFRKPEECFTLPIGFYKITPEIVVIISAITAEIYEKSVYSIAVQTFNLKKGKLIAEERTLGSFSNYLKFTCQLSIDAKGKISTTTKGGYGGDVTTNITVSNKGKLKLL